MSKRVHDLLATLADAGMNEEPIGEHMPTARALASAYYSLVFLRQAQRRYMEKRGDHARGQAVARAAAIADLAIEEVEAA